MQSQASQQMSTAVTFDFDPAEGIGGGFLTPVYFDNEVLVKHLYSKTIAVEFASETYGTIHWPDDYMSFGINSKNTVIAWLGDLEKLPVSEQHHWREYNIASQHDMESEFYDAQIGAAFTEPPIGIQAINALEKWNIGFAAKHGSYLYKPTSFKDRLEAVRRYRRIIIKSEDDFIRFIIELNEIINENVDTKELRDLLSSEGVKFDIGKKGNKLLEHVYKDVLGDTTNLIAPFFWLYDLRLWGAHSVGDEALKKVAAHLGVTDLADYEGILTSLMTKLRDAAKKLQESYA